MNPGRLYFIRTCVLAPLVSVALALSGCARQPEEIVFSGPTMGTTYTVKIAAPPGNVDRHAVRVVIDEVLALVDVQMSGYRPDSEVARFNALASTDWFPVSAELVQVAEAALDVAARSRGALDVTIGSLVDLWGFGPGGERAEAPQPSQVEALTARTGYRKLHVRVDPPALRKEVPELTVDLNAIAPGFAVDLLATRLAAVGFEDFMVDIGGEIRVRGRNARRESWRIAVERPFDTEPVPYAILQLDDEAVATSGGYRRFREHDGERYSHTIDPATGRPVPSRLASVVVVEPTAMSADAWATALLVLGNEEGYATAQRENLAALFILWDGAALSHRSTPRMRKYFVRSPGLN